MLVLFFLSLAFGLWLRHGPNYLNRLHLVAVLPFTFFFFEVSTLKIKEKGPWPDPTASARLLTGAVVLVVQPKLGEPLSSGGLLKQD